MKQPIIVGNWKMNKTIAEAVVLVKTIHDALFNLNLANNPRVIVAPPYTSLNKIAEFLKNSFIAVSSQDFFWEEAGAYTGQVSVSMIKDAGANYAIIGHSERRQFFGETDDTVNKKIKAAIKHEIIPIFCVGETQKEREDKKAQEVIKSQILTGLKDLNEEDIKTLIIAYEPVWAIGTGLTPAPRQVEEVHIMIRDVLEEKFSKVLAESLSILYGGSIKPLNIVELVGQKNIDGVLVGGASLNPQDFIEIILLANRFSEHT